MWEDKDIRERIYCSIETLNQECEREWKITREKDERIKQQAWPWGSTPAIYGYPYDYLHISTSTGSTKHELNSSNFLRLFMAFGSTHSLTLSFQFPRALFATCIFLIFIFYNKENGTENIHIIWFFAM